MAQRRDGHLRERSTSDPAPGYRFKATITKGAKKMEMMGTATSKISLHGVRVVPANVEADSSLYKGPAFNELDPHVQVRLRRADATRISCAALDATRACIVLMVLDAHELLFSRSRTSSCQFTNREIS